MNIETIRDYCLSKQGVTECFPFDDVSLVFKVMDKMFALTSLDGDLMINLKCDPDKAIELREKYPFILPGYHMNKKHWNTVQIHSQLSIKLLQELIDHSYALVVNGLPKSKREELNKMK